MARFVPPLQVSSGRSDAEVKVLRWLSRLGPRWTVIHSMGVLTDPFKRWSEADAIVIGPPGLMVIEVKGGRVARKNGVWSFVDRHGHVDRRREGPFDQAGGAHAAIRAVLLAANALSRMHSSGYGVLFPDVTFLDQGPDVLPQVMLDASSEWADPEPILVRWCQYWGSRTGQDRGLSEDEADGVVDCLRGDLQLEPSLSLYADSVVEELTRLTTQQHRVVAAAADNERLLVTGRAGTGKTMLAAQEARRLATDGRRVLLTCSSRPLARLLRRSLAPSRSIDVAAVSEIRNGAGDSLATGRYDSLIVDEGQDVAADALLPTLDMAVDGGAEDGHWRVFLDPAQDLLGHLDEAVFEEIQRRATARLELTLNCRNTRQIAVFASMLTRLELDVDAPVLGPEVHTCWWSDRDVQEQLLSGEIRRLCKDLGPDRVVVLTTTPMSRARRNGLSNATGMRMNGMDDAAPGGVVCATAVEFKGLEADAVVLADVDRLTVDQARSHFYVACTRARSVLTALLHESVRADYDAGARWLGSVVALRPAPPAAFDI